jgi:hypothetical protein
MKLTLDINGEFIDNPTTQVQPVYNQGTVEQYFEWMNINSSILPGQSVSLCKRSEERMLPCGNVNGIRQVLKLRKQPESVRSSKNFYYEMQKSH